MNPLIQDLNVANDLLDQAEAKFKSISDVVGTTSQKMNQLTRATQLFVAETQRARNEYQRLSGVSPQGLPTAAPQVGAQTVGSAMVAASLQGQWGGAGAATYGYGAGGQQGVIGLGAMGGGGGAGQLPPVGGVGGGQAGGIPPWILLNQAQQSSQNAMQAFNRIAPANKNWMQKGIRGFNLGWGISAGKLTTNDATYVARQMLLQSQGGIGGLADLGMAGLPSNQRAMIEQGGFGDEAQTAMQNLNSGTAITDATQIASLLRAGAELGAGKEMAGSLATALGGKTIGGNLLKAANFLEPAAGPLLGATIGLYGASQANRMINAPLTSARNYGAMTGGTSVMGQGPQGFGESAMGYDILKKNLSGEWGIGPLKFDVNARVSGEEAQNNLNAVLAAGYSTGGALTPGSLANSNELGAQALTFLQQQTEKGFTDSAAAMQMWQNVVDKAGGSTKDLADTMDRFREISINTNVGMEQMVGNFNRLGESLAQNQIGAAAQTSYYKASAAGTYGAAAPGVRGSTVDATLPLRAMASSATGLTLGQISAGSVTGKITGGQISGMMAGAAKTVFDNLGLEPPTDDVVELYKTDRDAATKQWIDDNSRSAFAEMVAVNGAQMLGQFGYSGDGTIEDMWGWVFEHFYSTNAQKNLAEAEKMAGSLGAQFGTEGGAPAAMSTTDQALSYGTGGSSTTRGGGRKPTKATVGRPPSGGGLSAGTGGGSPAISPEMRDFVNKRTGGKLGEEQGQGQGSSVDESEKMRRAVSEGMTEHTRRLEAALRRKQQTSDWNA